MVKAFRYLSTNFDRIAPIVAIFHFAVVIFLTWASGVYADREAQYVLNLTGEIFWISFYALFIALIALICVVEVLNLLSIKNSIENNGDMIKAANHLLWNGDNSLSRKILLTSFFFLVFLVYLLGTTAIALFIAKKYLLGE